MNSESADSAPPPVEPDGGVDATGRTLRKGAGRQWIGHRGDNAFCDHKFAAEFGQRLPVK